MFKDQVFEEDEREYLPKKRKAATSHHDFDDDDEDVEKKAKLDESVAEAENIDNPFLRPVRMPRTAKTPAK